ncbi:MAG: hypothetical protein J5I94_30450, partial [Phaeodactylibacter sp.]|nr:hypothetical protein [Phaeodactylibacter sp.]
MQKSSLLRQLMALRPEERRRLGLFLASPYHNQREDVRQLYAFIDQRLEEDWGGLSKESAFAVVYSGEAFDAKKMNYLLSFLSKAVEGFLVQEEIRGDHVRNQWALLRAYRRRKMPRFFQKALKRARDFQRRSFRDVEHYELAYSIEWENYLHTAGEQRNLPSQLPVLNETLDTLFFIRRLKQSSLLQAHQSVFREEDDPRLLKLIMGFLEGSAFLEAPLIAVYYHYLKMVQEPGKEGYYQVFRQHILSGKGGLPKEERRALFLLAINYGIQRYNLGRESFLREVFVLYQAALEDGLLLEDGRMSRFAFKNIAGIGLRLEEYAWTEAFIHDFQHTLPPRRRSNY